MAVVGTSLCKRKEENIIIFDSAAKDEERGAR